MALQRPDTLTAAIAKHMRDAIVRGDYAPGSRLPEVALSRELQTSRGTVREALRTLADGGLVEIVPRRGMFVSQLSVSATWEITSLRALLEPYAARLALEASRSDPKLAAEVRQAFDGLRAAIATGDPLTVADADVAFHRAVFARCGHQMLLAELETLQILSRRVVLTNQLYAADAPTLIGQHLPIAQAVESGDGSRLEAAVRSHVIEAGELLMARMGAAEAPKARRTKGEASRFGRWPSGELPSPKDTSARARRGA